MDLFSFLGNSASIASFLTGLKKNKEKGTIINGDEVHKTRPEMDIVEYKNYLSRVKYGTKSDCDIDVFMAHIQSTSVQKNKKNTIVNAFYNDNHFNEDEWCCVKYKLKNAGKTDINVLDVICLFQRDTCLFSVSDARWYADNHLLNYSECYDKKIRVGETVTLRICYHKDAIIVGQISAILHIGMEDDNGRYWVQPLFAPADKIYSSRQVSYEAYLDEIKTTTAEKCFANPGLW